MWDWRKQFSETDINFFFNPSYDDNYTRFLKPYTSLSNLDIWAQCYFRWLPDLEIKNGGKPQIDFFCRLLVNDILRKKQGDINGIFKRRKDSLISLSKKINSFFPFSHNSRFISNDSVNNLILTGDMMDSQSILNFND